MNKKVVAAVGALVAVAAIAVGGVVTWLVHDAPTRPPVITAYSHGRTVDVEPYLYCDIYLRRCDDLRKSVDIDVPAPDKLQISLPEDVAAAPWNVLLDYVDAQGREVQKVAPTSPEYFRAGSKSAITVAPYDGDLKLRVVEIHLPSAVEEKAPNTGLFSRAVWSIHVI